ncbi:lytic transglycosylase [Psychrobacter urativorans]|uniref:lytic transglycosylase n=1 Tax=Psychrobacter urativorans TaxID=45610 RepID=UPI00191A4331|nr:LysM peptidoglycan-binding domain-containing protein [Psychrobacter urativorans]
MPIVTLNYRSFIALPLTLAVSTLLISACSSNTSTVKNTGATTGTPIVTKRPVNHTAATPRPRPSNTPTTSDDYSTAYLDADSLDELADLLEATDMTMVESSQLAIQQYGDLWDRLRAGYQVNGGKVKYDPRIEAQKSWFTSRQDYLNRLTARSSRYLYHTVREAERRNIPTELALLPVIESSYDPSGTSSAAAAGLWQFVPSTGRIFGLNQSSTYDGRRDVIESTRAAYDYLTALHNQFGSWELALASYNAGPGRIQKAIDANAARGLPTDYWSLKLPTETMNYVPRFLAVADIVSNPQQYGVYLPAIANRQHFRSVPANYGVSLAEVSQLTGVSYDELEKLNTALTSARIDGSGPQRVIIPNDVDLNVDASLSSLKGNGTSNVIASSVPSSSPSPSYTPSPSPSYTPPKSSSTTTTPSYNNQPYSNSSLPSTGSGLAEYAASANVPQQTTSYISPSSTLISSSVYSSNTPISSEPPITSKETSRINAELKSSNSLPTTSAQITQNNTITQEPALTREERDFIAAQIMRQSPGVSDVISAIDGNIKLSAVQTQLSILEASGKDKKLSFASTPASTPKPKGTRTTYKIKSGDTLVNIASRADLSWRDIAEWNQIDPGAKLYTGSTLYLYNAKTIEPLSTTSSSTKSNSSTSNSSSSASTAPRKPDSYVVQAGDTLIGTANRFGLSVSQLATYNNLSTHADLLRDQKLWLIAGKVSATASTGSKNTGSSSNSSNTNTSTPTSNYTVKSGDTLTGIANSIGVSATQVAAVNSSFDNQARLQRGQTIKVPVTKAQAERQLNAKPISYKIQSGDTLTGVAKRYNIGISDLASANELNTNSNLILGRSITIPANGSRATPSTSKSSSSTSSSSSGGKDLSNIESYKVQPGDGLIALARRFGVSVDDLAATNNMATTGQLQLGQTIKVPKTTVSYTVGSGDSLIGLARKYGVSAQELADMNKIAADTMLQRGQRLTVPNR